MFVGGSVVNGVHTKGGDHAFQTAFVLHRAQKRQDFAAAAVLPLPFVQLAFDGVEGELGKFEQHQPRGAAGDNLAAQLRADGAARAGYHHAFAGDVQRHQFRIGFDRLASQEVGDGDFFQYAGVDAAVHQVFPAGDGQHFAGVGFEAAQDGAAGGGRRAGDGE